MPEIWFGQKKCIYGIDPEVGLAVNLRNKSLGFKKYLKSSAQL